jgi:hypothetical protein
MRTSKEQTEKNMLRKYNAALAKAISHIFRFNLEPASALQAAGASEGIESGGEMLQFINWANLKLEERGLWL